MVFKAIKLKKILIVIAAVVLLLNAGNVLRLFYPAKYVDYIKKYAAAYDVDPYLGMSVIKAESNYEHEAVSHKNATGLMQITEPTAGWIAEMLQLDDFTYEQVTEPEMNIRMGCYYIDYLMEMYGGNVKCALAAYNAGLSNVDKWLENREYSKDGVNLSSVPFPETERYIDKVLNAQKMYRLLYRVKGGRMV